ncbi:hypothetical protein Tco_0621978, partial [Tanacetum coccineum]
VSGECYLHVPLDEIKVDKTLRFVEEPVEIMNREIRKLKRRKIVLVIVRWNLKRGPEFTWEHEDLMRIKYEVQTNMSADMSVRVCCAVRWDPIRSGHVALAVYCYLLVSVLKVVQLCQYEVKASSLWIRSEIAPPIFAELLKVRASAIVELEFSVRFRFNQKFM